MAATLVDDPRVIALTQAPMLTSSPSTVMVAVENRLNDIALVSLIRQFGLNACTIDVAEAPTLPRSAAALVVQSARALNESLRRYDLSAIRIIGLGTRVDHVDGIEFADSPYAVGGLRACLRDLADITVDRVHLSRRELEIVTSYTLGTTVRNTASAHFVAESTVRTHIQRVMTRYREAGRLVNNKSQLLVELLSDGWIHRSQLHRRALDAR